MVNSEPLRSIHVVAGVICDARGRILLTRRTEGRDLAGRWEFPGGKREPGETSEQALVRELQEELGIHASVGEWIMEVPQRYPDKRLRLEVRRILNFKGTPRGQEGQALLWVMPDKLDRYDMPPADKPVVSALLRPDRYLITPTLVRDNQADWLVRLERALKSGLQRVLLQLTDIEGIQRHALCEQAVALCRLHGAQPMVHDDEALAASVGAGLHLSSERLMPLTERPVAADVALAASCNSANTLATAERLGCDFAVVPVVSAKTEAAGLSDGWSAFDQLRERTSLPIYAMDVAGRLCLNVEDARRHGGQGIAVTDESLTGSA